MATATTFDDSEAQHLQNAKAQDPQPRWTPLQRIAFRFCFVYFTLYTALSGMLMALLSIPKVDMPDLGSLFPIRAVIFWTASHIFAVKQQPVYQNSGSGDKIYDWTTVFLIPIVSVLATVVWSLLDRNRTHYTTLLKWLRLYLRFALATQMISYGMDKVIPLQMSFPHLSQLMEPYGYQSPMGVLWNFVGASPAYEIICGSVEVLCAILLYIPRTTLLGALATAAVTAQVFILNMTYDIPVKQYSLHLMLTALFLAAPDLPRLYRFFLGYTAVEPSTHPALFETQRSNRIALQAIFALWLAGSNLYINYSYWQEEKKDLAPAQLFGIWSVTSMTIDGKERPALEADNDRWRRVIFQSRSSLTWTTPPTAYNMEPTPKPRP